MKTLIVEDDFYSRFTLKELLSPFGDCDITVNGREAVQAFQMALQANAPYDLICMDIMMPEMDGQEALKLIRQMEKDREISDAKEVKVIMTTALNDPKSVFEAYHKGGANSYMVKPIIKDKLVRELTSLGLI